MSLQKYRGYFNYIPNNEKIAKSYTFNNLTEDKVLELAKKFRDKSKYTYIGHKVNKE